MCGIVGYLGSENAVPFLLDGLKKLEYRGYDSAGVGIIDQKGQLVTLQRAGKLNNLERALWNDPIIGNIGIGHTRWATHGLPTEKNAHPQSYGSVALVHNGIIENYLELKKQLISQGINFISDTDTEVIAVLVEIELEKGKNLKEAVLKAAKKLVGSFALGVISSRFPDRMIAIKNASPLVIGLAQGYNLLASDIPALLQYTREVIFMDEGEIAEITSERVGIFDFQGRVKEKISRHISWTPEMAEKGGFKHFMLKEIFEQPRAIQDTIQGRMTGSRHFESALIENLPALEELKKIRRITLAACGTSFHAGMIGKYYFEHFLRLPAEVDLASEFIYRHPLIGNDTLFIVISQSGETADTLAALRLARKAGATVLSICNVMDSSIARESDYCFLTFAGPEIGVASTKAFTTQLAGLLMIAACLGDILGSVSVQKNYAPLENLREIPLKMERQLEEASIIKEISRQLTNTHSSLYLGRGLNYPIALEGALKLKEISYIHAEGYAAGEMKHGPIALIDEKMPVVIIAPKDDIYSKIISNMQEVKARKGIVIALTDEGNSEVEALADFSIFIPKTHPLLWPFVTIIPLQLLAYYISDFKGTDIDQPRNLAKSVTVE